MTLYMLKVHLQTFLSVPITQKCQILSCDTLVASKRKGLYWMGVFTVMGTARWIERVHIDIEVKRLFYAIVNSLILDQ